MVAGRAGFVDDASVGGVVAVGVDEVDDSGVGGIRQALAGQFTGGGVEDRSVDRFCVHIESDARSLEHERGLPMYVGTLWNRVVVCWLRFPG